MIITKEISLNTTQIKAMTSNKSEYVRGAFQMNLLEYIRKRNEMTRPEWEEVFEKEEIEILVLIKRMGGAGKRNGFWEAQVNFLAYEDYNTGILHKEEGLLVYPISDEEYENDHINNRFKDETIYRLKVRLKGQEELPECMTKAAENRLLLVEILEENAPCTSLEEILTEYKKPIILKDEILGDLTLNKELSLFEGNLAWQDEIIDISLDINKDNKSSWTKARNSMKKMLLEQGNWDKEMRNFAAKKLTALACEWRDSEDEPVPEITEQSFSNRITLKSISMTSGGSFSAYFDDDDMFFGHCIIVQGSLKKGLVSANMGG